MRTERSALRWLCAFGAALCLLSGCPGKLEDKAEFLAALEDAGDLTSDAGPCGDVPARIFKPSCGNTGCHGATAPQQGLDLVSPGLAARVVGIAGKVCTSTLADPADPASSLLYTKLVAQPSCGAQMPLGQPPLGTADAACVLAWIAAQ